MKFSLWKKIVLVVGIIILSVSMGIGYNALMTSSRTIRHKAEDSLEELAKEGAQHVASVINGELNVLYELGNKETVKSMNYTTQKQDLSSSVARLGYEDMAIINLNGKGQYINKETTLDIADQAYFKEALEGAKVVSDVILDPQTSELLLMYAVPIEVKDRVVGVLIGQKDVRALNQITSNMGFGENGYAYILDEKGVFYSNPNEALIMGQKNIMEDIEAGGDFKDMALEFQALGLGNPGHITYALEGSQRMAGVSIVPTTNWILAMGASEDDVLTGDKEMQEKVFFTAIAVLVLGIIGAWFFGKTISAPIVRLSKELERFSNYDVSLNETNNVTKYMSRKDEIGSMAISLRKMQENLIDLIGNIANASQDVATSSQELTATSNQSASASNELARAIEDIANGASDQARDTENGATNIDALGLEVETAQRIIQLLYKSTEEVNRIKDSGLEVIKDLIGRTEDNQSSTKEIKDIILGTDESAEKINRASVMIKEISKQTNLLALNAAIEAARAGEAGRGFAVVADEIKKLAEESSDFAQEIEKVVEELMIKTQGSVEIMGRMGETTQMQRDCVFSTTKAFEKIAHKLQEVNNQVQKADHSGNIMALKKDEMVGIIQNLSAIAQQNAAGTQEASASVEEQAATVQEIAGASESLSNLSIKLQKLVSVFTY